MPTEESVALSRVLCPAPSQPHGAGQPGSRDPAPCRVPRLLGQTPGRNFLPCRLWGSPFVTCSSKGRTIVWEFCAPSGHAVSGTVELGAGGEGLRARDLPPHPRGKGLPPSFLRPEDPSLPPTSSPVLLEARLLRHLACRAQSLGFELEGSFVSVSFRPHMHPSQSPTSHMIW